MGKFNIENKAWFNIDGHLKYLGTKKSDKRDVQVCHYNENKKIEVIQKKTIQLKTTKYMK